MFTSNNKMSKLLPWIDGWFSDTAILPEFDPNEQKIYNTIKTGWNTQERIGLLNNLKSQYGDSLKITIKKLVRSNLIRDWKIFAQDNNDNSLVSYIDTLWSPLKAQGFEYTLNEKNGEYNFNVTKCPLANLAKEIAGEEWIIELVCMGDFYMVEGFNPEIKFSRDKILPAGDDYCNHSYKM